MGAASAHGARTSQIGLEFEVPGNFWGIAFPPEDWASGVDIPTGDLTGMLEVATTAEPAAGISPQPLPPIGPPPIPTPVTPEKRIEAPPFQIPVTPPAPAKPTPVNTQVNIPTAPPVQPPAVPAAPSAPAASPSADNKIHVVPAPPAAAVVTADTQAALAKQMARMVADAKETLDKTLRRGAEEAITEEMTVVRQQLDAQLHDTVEKARRSPCCKAGRLRVVPHLPIWFIPIDCLQELHPMHLERIYG